MKNSLGNPARGDAFYPRNKEVAKIYRALNSGVSIYLSAPRRVGKTSILRHIEESPEEGYYFVYVITESVYEPNEFFKVIYDGLLKSDALSRMSKISQAIFDGLGAVVGGVKKIHGVELRELKEPDYFYLLIDLLSKTQKDTGRLIIQIDEFPQTIQNISNNLGSKEAEKFIQQNRELRHHDDLDAVQFVYTGSLSLYPIVEEITELTAVNDMRTVEVGELTPEEGIDFLQQLLIEEKLSLPEPVLKYVMEGMRWLIPFHLQLIAQELIEVHESTGLTIGLPEVDKAFDQVVHVRNRPQFEPYFARLSNLFHDEQYDFVMEVLKHVAKNDVIDENELNDYAVKYNIQEIQRIKNILEGDGYLYYNHDKGYYQYTSPILQMWCKKHICR